MTSRGPGLSPIDLESEAFRQRLDAQDGTICAVDGKLDIRWVNAGWYRFAERNAAAADAPVRTRPIGLNVLEVTPEAMRPFYQRLYREARRRSRGGPPLRHVYVCSTPTVQRTNVMHLYRTDRGGLLVVHTTLREHPVTGTFEPLEAVYRDPSGIATMCASCRRVRRIDGTGWDFVPDWVLRMPPRLSHGLCEICTSDLYGSLVWGRDD